MMRVHIARRCSGAVQGSHSVRIVAFHTARKGCAKSQPKSLKRRRDSGEIFPALCNFIGNGRGLSAYCRSRMETKMTDEQLMRLKVYGNNVQRYRRLLKGNLTEQEREFVERRLTEEQLAIQRLRTNGLVNGTSEIV